MGAREKSVRAAANTLTRIGERHDIQFLIYNPFLFLWYHRRAVLSAPTMIHALERQFPAAKNYADVGAGSGAFAAQARRRGHRVVACEHSRIGRGLARLQGLSARPFDLERPQPAEVPGNFDLAYSFEVAEHLPPLLGDRLVGYLCSLAPTVVFTAAHPGQGGVGHVNEQPREYWVERFAAEGFRHDPDGATSIKERLTQGRVDDWLVDNLMVFRRADTQGDTARR